MNYIGWLFYTEQDAQNNDAFIQALIKEAREQHIDLQLVFKHEFNTLIDKAHVTFIWNRTRNHYITEYFEQKNIKVFNNSYVNKIANNKWETYILAKQLNIPCIPTWKCLPKNVQFPVVVKSISGHGGQEVALCHNPLEVSYYRNHFGQEHSIIQPYIESNKQDIRVWSLGNKILGSVLRTGTNDFKSNYSLGGTIEKFQVHEELITQIQVLASHLKSFYIGIDFIRSVDGRFYLNEIEDPVGARSYFNLYNDDLCKILITHIKQSITQTNV